MSYDIVIIGAGAAGMMAGIYASEYVNTDARILIIDHMEKTGKKLLATGNGRCNFTNDVLDDTCYRGLDPSFAHDIIRQYNKEWLISAMEELGIVHTSINGYYYPRSLQAKTVVDCMVSKLESNNVEMVLGISVQHINKHNEEYVITTSCGDYYARKVIIATGGKSYSKLGSTGEGYNILKELQHDMTDTVPALIGLKAKGLDFRLCQGTRARCNITICADDEHLADAYGEIQFTEYGISGIPVFQVSRYASYALKQNRKVYAMLDCIPDMSTEELAAGLCRISDIAYYKTLTELLNGYLPMKLGIAIAELTGIKKETKVSDIGKNDIYNISAMIKNIRIRITGDMGFDKAQVTAGGIKTSQVDRNTMESNVNNGLYIAGEILDIDGTCGGYNLHFAFATGAIAGMSAAMSL